MTDAEAETNAAADPDLPPSDPAWLRAAGALMAPQVQRTPISLRMDPEVLAFFREGGPGYQSRINAVLRAYVEHRKTYGRDVRVPGGPTTRARQKRGT